MKQPEDVQLSREEGEALIERLERNTLTAADRRVLGRVLTYYFWLLFALREAKLSLKRLKALVFGEKPKPPKPPPADGAAGGGSAGGNATPTSITRNTFRCCSGITPREETATAGPWAVRRGGLSRGADGDVSA